MRWPASWPSCRSRARWSPPCSTGRDARGIGFSHFVSLGEHADVDFGDMLDYLASDAQHARHPALHRVDRVAAQVHVGRARRGAQQAGDRGQGRALRRRASAPRPRTPARWPAPTWCTTPPSAAPACCAWTRCRSCSWPPRRWRAFARNRCDDAHDPDQRRRRRRDGRRRGGARRREAGRRWATPRWRELDAVLPANWSHGNPVDIIGDAPVERYVQALQACCDDPAAGAVLFIHAPTAIVPSAEIARALVPLAQPQPTPRLMALLAWRAAVAEARQTFQRRRHRRLRRRPRRRCGRSRCSSPTAATRPS